VTRASAGTVGIQELEDFHDLTSKNTRWSLAGKPPRKGSVVFWERRRVSVNDRTDRPTGKNQLMIGCHLPICMTSEVRVCARYRPASQGRITAHHRAQSRVQIRRHASACEHGLRLLNRPKGKKRTGKRLAQKSEQDGKPPASWSAWIDAH